MNNEYLSLFNKIYSSKTYHQSEGLIPDFSRKSKNVEEFTLRRRGRRRKNQNSTVSIPSTNSNTQGSGSNVNNPSTNSNNSNTDSSSNKTCDMDCFEKQNISCDNGKATISNYVNVLNKCCKGGQDLSVNTISNHANIFTNFCNQRR